MVSKVFIKFVEPLLFPVKLYQLAHSNEIKSIGWSKNGTAVLLDTGSLREECFNTGIFKVIDHRHVFRQLSYYGFQRTDKTANVYEFYHPRFLSDRLDLVKTIRRSGKKNRNTGIENLSPFIERRTSNRIKSKGRKIVNNLSDEDFIKIETDSESSDDYDRPTTSKRPKRKTRYGQKIVKKSRTAAKENILHKSTSKRGKGEIAKENILHKSTSKRGKGEIAKENILHKSTPKRGKGGKDFSAMKSIVESAHRHQPFIRDQRYVTGTKEEDLHKKEDIGLQNKYSRKKNYTRRQKEDPSRHATPERNAVVKEEVSTEVVDFTTTGCNSKSDNELQNRIPKSEENLKVSPIKLRVTGLSNSLNPLTSGNDDVSFICSILPNSKRSRKSNGNFILGRSYEWIPVNSCDDKSDVRPVEKDTLVTPEQFRIPGKPSQSHYGTSKNICYNTNTSDDSVNNIVKSSCSQVDTNKQISDVKSHHSFLKRKQCSVVTGNCSHSSSKFPKSIQSSEISTLKEKVKSLKITAGNSSILDDLHAINQASFKESSGDLSSVSDDHSSVVNQGTARNSTNDSSFSSGISFSISAVSEDQSSVPEDHSSINQATGRNSNNDTSFSSGISFSVGQTSESQLIDDFSSNSNDSSLTSETVAEEPDYTNNVTRSYATVSEDNIEEEIIISPEKKEEVVEYLYIEFKNGKMHSWELLESSDRIVRHCAYDALTLDVEKARGNEMDFGNI